jgi:hypothetical protein
MKKLMMVFIGIMAVLGLNCCGPKEIIKLDLASYEEDPEAYKDKRVIIATDIASLINDPTLFYYKDIQISGIINNRPIGLDWGFYLENEDGLSVKCYEKTYRHSPWSRADNAVKRARRNSAKITIVGVFSELHDIELDWIDIGGEIINTNYKPDYLGPRFRR